ncbi:MAG: hypothetical protein ABEJ59_05380 [Halanaeroarchaeum sp.]
MARPDTGIFATYLTAAGVGLFLAGMLFGADACAFTMACRATIWDYFYGMGIVLTGVGAPVALVGNLGRYLHGG